MMPKLTTNAFGCFEKVAPVSDEVLTIQSLNEYSTIDLRLDDDACSRESDAEAYRPLINLWSRSVGGVYLDNT